MLFFYLNILIVKDVFSMDSTISVSGGYDSNIGQDEHNNESFFSEYQFKSNFAKNLEKLDIETNLSVSSNYRDYFSYDDNYLLRLDLIFSRNFPKSIKGELFLTSYLYRGDFLTDDENNTVGIGYSMTFYGLSYSEIYIDAGYYSREYKNDVMPFSGRSKKSFNDVESFSSVISNDSHTKDNGSKGNGNGRGGSKLTEPEQRIDSIIKTTAGLKKFFTSKINLEFSIDYERLVSEIDLESYHSLGIKGEIIWMPANNIKFDLVSGISEAYYDKLINITDTRKDQLYTLNLRTSYYFNKMELYVFYDYQQNNSPLKTEDFIQSVTACGISYSF